MSFIKNLITISKKVTFSNINNVFNLTQSLALIYFIIKFAFL